MFHGIQDYCSFYRHFKELSLESFYPLEFRKVKRTGNGKLELRTWNDFYSLPYYTSD